MLNVGFLKDGPLNLEVYGTAYCEGEEHTEKVPANVCHLGKGLSDTMEMGLMDSPEFPGYLLLQLEPDGGYSPLLRNKPSPKRPPLTKANYEIVDRNGRNASSFVRNAFEMLSGASWGFNWYLRTRGF